MSATNSRIAKLRRIKLDLEQDYWSRKASHTKREAIHYGAVMGHLDELIEQEKLRTVDYLKAS